MTEKFVSGSLKVRARVKCATSNDVNKEGSKEGVRGRQRLALSL
jgi:hypothetical protein